MEENEKFNTSLEVLLKTVVHNKASDLHIVSRSEPQIRIDGNIEVKAASNGPIVNLSPIGTITISGL